MARGRYSCLENGLKGMTFSSISLYIYATIVVQYE